MIPSPLTNGDTKKSSEMSFSEGMKLVFEFGYIIALPACAFGIIGAYLDSLLHVPLHILLVVFLIIAFTLSTIIVAKKIRALTDAAKSQPLGHS